MFSFKRLLFLTLIILLPQKVLSFAPLEEERLQNLKTTFSLTLLREGDETIPSPKERKLPIGISFLPNSSKPLFIVPTHETPEDIRPRLDSFFGVGPYERRSAVGEHVELVQDSDRTMHAVRYASPIIPDAFKREILSRFMLLQNLALESALQKNENLRVLFTTIFASNSQERLNFTSIHSLCTLLAYCLGGQEVHQNTSARISFIIAGESISFKSDMPSERLADKMRTFLTETLNLKFEDGRLFLSGPTS